MDKVFFKYFFTLDPYQKEAPVKKIVNPKSQSLDRILL